MPKAPASIGVQPVSFGPYVLASRFALSPMAEYTSWPLRVLAQEFGAALSCTEMVKARFVVAREPETLKTLERHPVERLCGAQICGADPGELAEAARVLVEEYGFPFIDLNAACPSRRIVGEGAGGGLMLSPTRVEEALRAMRAAIVPVPVSIKMRAGLDAENITAIEVALAAEAGGAALIAIHPRTVRQGYGGEPDHELIARVVECVEAPVIGGGNVGSARDAVRILRETGCALVHFARAAIGDPWIFARAQKLLETGEEPPFPERAELVGVLRRHFEMLVAHAGIFKACLHFRRLSREYARLILEAGTARQFYESFRKVETAEQIRRGLDAFIS